MVPASRPSSMPSPALSRPGATRSASGASRSAGCADDQVLERGIALVPEGRRLFPSLTVEENLLIGGQLGRRAAGTLDGVYALFPVLGERRNAAATSTVRRPAADVRHRPGADVEPGLHPVRRDQPRAGADRHQGASTPRCPRSSPAAPARSSSSRTSPARWPSPQRVVCLQEGRVSLEGRPGDLDRAAISAAYFGT